VSCSGPDGKRRDDLGRSGGGKEVRRDVLRGIGRGDGSKIDGFGVGGVGFGNGIQLVDRASIPSRSSRNLLVVLGTVGPCGLIFLSDGGGSIESGRVGGSCESGFGRSLTVEGALPTWNGAEWRRNNSRRELVRRHEWEIRNVEGKRAD
jgi:hypothetical protein